MSHYEMFVNSKLKYCNEIMKTIFITVNIVVLQRHSQLYETLLHYRLNFKKGFLKVQLEQNFKSRLQSQIENSKDNI